MFDLYVVTDSDLSRGRTDAETARLAYEGGADAVQLRMKHTDGREMLCQARQIASMAAENDRFFFVNDRVDIAMASGADGVHSTTFGISTLEKRTRAFAYPSCPSAK